MGERIAEVDPDTGEIIGSVDRAAAHRDGVWHAAIHVWVLDDTGRLLFQQRAATKAQFPDMWDISAAGHFDAGEDGLREVAEELGVTVTPDDLALVGMPVTVYRDDAVFNRERPRVYVWRSELPLHTFRFVDGEVTALASVELHDVRALIAGSPVRCPVFRDGQVHRETLTAPLVPQSDAYWDLLLGHLGV